MPSPFESYFLTSCLLVLQVYLHHLLVCVPYCTISVFLHSLGALDDGVLVGCRVQPLLQASAVAVAVAVARLSHRNSLRPSVTRVDQSKAVQARITKFSPSAAWRTPVSGTVKFFHKFEGGHPERGR